MRFLFFYLMIDDPARVRDSAARHAAYWQQHAPLGYLGGPFADRSGGLITFEVDSPSQADQLVGNDPFIVDGVISRWWLHHWLTAAAAPATSTGGSP